MNGPFDWKHLSLKDALDLAILVEEEACERYRRFDEMLGSSHPGDAAEFFRTMVGNELKHRDALRQRREQLFGSAPVQVDPGLIEDVEAPGLDQPRPFMGPAQAMRVALAGEKKAQAFFAEALRHVGDPGVRALFQELEAEEVEHQRALERLMKDAPEGPEREVDEVDAPELD